jgi:acylphosphatase
LHFKGIPRTLPNIMLVRVHIIVHGLVQGVGFRYFVYKKAVNLNLTGYVRNLFSGDVEIEAEGNRSLIEEFIEEVKIGPSAADVTDMKIDWMKCLNTESRFELH